MPTTIEIYHKPSGELIASGKKGWHMFPFEGNFYISRSSLKTNGFQCSGIPGICPYKFLYFWYHFSPNNGEKSAMLGWKYWLPNPLFPFIAFRIAVPARHSHLEVKYLSEDT